MKKIKIKILQKNNIKSTRLINKNNKRIYNYDRKKRVWIKKSKNEIKKIKILLRQKKVKKIKEKKLIKKKPQVKKINCNFNYKNFYRGINHNGYVRNNNLDFFVDIDTSTQEIESMVNILKSNLENNYKNLACPLRMMYVKLHYHIQLSNNLDDIRNSSNTTHVTFYIKTLKNNMTDMFIDIIKLVENYISVNIYKQEFVNYEFNSILKMG